MTIPKTAAGADPKVAPEAWEATRAQTQLVRDEEAYLAAEHTDIGRAVEKGLAAQVPRASLRIVKVPHHLSLEGFGEGPGGRSPEQATGCAAFQAPEGAAQGRPARVRFDFEGIIP